MSEVRILITDGGVHPADKWAALTAAQICDLIQIDENSASPEAVAARKAKPRLQLDLADLLETFHANLQTRERAALASDGSDHLATPPDPNDGVIDTPEEVAEAVAEAAAGGPFAAHFALEGVKAVVRGIVMDHFLKVIDIERSTFADKEGGEAAETYRAARLELGARDAWRALAEPDPA